MKHLEPEVLAGLADGAPADPAAAAHLRACPACRTELAALRALIGDLGSAPAPSPALRRATLRRLGLHPREKGGALRWAWLPAAAALALVWLLPHPSATPPSNPIQAPAAVAARPSHPAQAQSLAQVRAVPTVSAGEAPALPAAPESAALPAPEAPPSAPAVGRAADPQALPELRVGQEAKATAVPALPAFAVQVRNNLIRPGQSLVLSVALDQADFVLVQAFDGRGRLADTLYQGPAGPGTLMLHWEAAGLPSAAYTLRVKAKAGSQIIKVLVAR